MRASRLVTFLLSLQTRGQLTVAELAELLDVSERTVQRDAHALVEAGVPIVSARGPAGGYRLDRGYRTKLTGLDASEAEALFVSPAAELGLVLKAGVWYLLAERRGEERVYRVSRIVSARERPEACARPGDFDLATAWARRSEAFERSRGHIEVTLRVPRQSVRYLRAAEVVEDGERPTVIARYEGLEHAFHSLLGWGAQVEVLAPRALRERIAASANETAALYADTSRDTGQPEPQGGTASKPPVRASERSVSTGIASPKPVATSIA